MNFNPNTTKHAQDVIFSRKLKKVHPPLLFNNASVTRTSSQNHLGIILGNQLKFDEHIKIVSRKIRKTIGLLRKLQNFLPRAAFIKYIKLLLDTILIMVIFFMIKCIMSFHQKLESNACLAITGAIRSTSKEKLYQELGLESQLRRWY